MAVIKWALDDIMDKKDVSNLDLAEMTGLHKGSISRLRCQKTMPRELPRNTLITLCVALDVDPGDLLILEKAPDVQPDPTLQEAAA